jgi:hypothetical protein
MTPPIFFESLIGLEYRDSVTANCDAIFHFRIAGVYFLDISSRAFLSFASKSIRLDSPSVLD